MNYICKPVQLLNPGDWIFSCPFDKQVKSIPSFENGLRIEFTDGSYSSCLLGVFLVATPIKKYYPPRDDKKSGWGFIGMSR